SWRHLPRHSPLVWNSFFSNGNPIRTGHNGRLAGKKGKHLGEAIHNPLCQRRAHHYSDTSRPRHTQHTGVKPSRPEPYDSTSNDSSSDPNKKQGADGRVCKQEDYHPDSDSLCWNNTCIQHVPDNLYIF